MFSGTTRLGADPGAALSFAQRQPDWSDFVLKLDYMERANNAADTQANYTLFNPHYNELLAAYSKVAKYIPDDYANRFGQVSDKMTKMRTGGSENFLTRSAGPLPVYGWGLLGIGGLCLGLYIRHMTKGAK